MADVSKSFEIGVTMGEFTHTTLSLSVTPPPRVFDLVSTAFFNAGVQVSSHVLQIINTSFQTVRELLNYIWSL